MGRVVHFEIHASHPEQLADFYRTIFDWDIQKWDGPWDYWLIGTGDPARPGIHGALVQRHGEAPPKGQPVNSFVCTVDVDDVDAVLAKALEQGATLALPKMQIPGVGWLVYVTDPDGNLLGMMQSEPSVAGG